MRQKPCPRFLIVPILLLGALAGCVTAKRTEVQDQMLIYDQSMRFANVRFNNCMIRAQVDPAFVAVRYYFASPAESPTDEQLNNNTLPTAEDAASLRKYLPLQEKCRANLVSEVERVSPMEAAHYREFFRDSDAILNDLIERKITWGESAKRKKDLAASDREKLAVVHDKMAAELQKQHRAELRQRRMSDTPTEP